MKKNILYLGLIIIIIVTSIIFISTRSETKIVKPIDNVSDNINYQKVVISMKNSNYYPREIRVKANQPVEITMDNSVYGCFRSLVIRGLGVSGYSLDPSDKIVFTPKQQGVYTFTCSMNMAYGKFIVE